MLVPSVSDQGMRALHGAEGSGDGEADVAGLRATCVSDSWLRRCAGAISCGVLSLLNGPIGCGLLSMLFL